MTHIEIVSAGGQRKGLCESYNIGVAFNEKFVQVACVTLDWFSFGVEFQIFPTSVTNRSTHHLHDCFTHVLIIGLIILMELG